MACCGGSTSRPAGSAQSRESAPALLEYSGRAEATMFGRVTGVRYHFPGPGARVYVDARDAPAFEVVTGFTRVSDSAGK